MEVMVAMGILSGMVIALSASWVSLSKASLDLLLKQKAVFVLNGEMERLTALYQMTNFGEGAEKATSGYTPITGISDTRLIYPMDVGPYMPAASDNFVETSLTQFDSGADSLVLVVSGETETDNRSYVWIDRARSFLAQASWTKSDVTPDACSFGTCVCFDFGGTAAGDPCQALTLVLTYPYRFDVTEGVVADADLDSLTLRTIVGRRL